MGPPGWHLYFKGGWGSGTGWVDHQTALLTLVNTARRTLLGGIEIVGLPDVISAATLAPNQPLRHAVHDLGGVGSYGLSADKARIALMVGLARTDGTPEEIRGWMRSLQSAP